MQSKGLAFTAAWMPSHSKSDAAKRAKLPEWCLPWHVDGNDQADKAAEAAAASVDLDLNIVNPVLKYDKVPARIQARYAAILMHIEHRAIQRKDLPLPKEPKAQMPAVSTLLAVSEHTLLHVGSSFVCTSCCGRISATSPCLHQFLLCPCTRVVAKRSRRPFPLFSQVAFNGRLTHKSHSLAAYGQYVFCAKCGFYGVSRIKGLAKPCAGHTTTSSSQFLANLTKLNVDLAQPLDESCTVADSLVPLPTSEPFTSEESAALASWRLDFLRCLPQEPSF